MKSSSQFVILLGLGVFWGISVPLTKLAVSTGHHPFGLLFWQFLVTFICLLPLVIVRRSNLVVDARHIAFFLTICAIGTLVPNFASFSTYAHLPGSIMALLIAFVPLFALLVALAIGLEKFDKVRMLGVFLGFIAMGLIILPESSLPDPSKVLWVFAGLVAPLCYGVEGNYLTLKQPADTGPVATLFGASIVGLMIITPLVYFTGTFVNLRGGMGIAEWSMIGSSIVHVVAYAGYIWLVSFSGPVFASLVGYVYTPAGMVFSILILSEAPSPYIWIALVLVFAALTLVRPRQHF